MRKIWIWACMALHAAFLNAQTQPKLEYFSLQDIRLLDGPFRHAEDLNRKYLLSLDADKLLAPFLREAGLPARSGSYGNWESSGLDGHIGGHYLSALSLMYASTGDPDIRERLDYMVGELKRCQDQLGNGYIGGVPGGVELWEKIEKGDIAAGSFELGKKWVPLYNIHKTYAGLRDAYLVAGNKDAKDMLVRMTDWMIRLTERLSDEQMQDMLRSEHGGLNETFADVAAITGAPEYLRLAQRFSHRAILDPLLGHEDKLTGYHANTQIPKVIGFKRIADLEKNDSWAGASAFFWETVVCNRSISIGGNSTYEHFNPTDDFSRMMKGTQGPETCNTYNMLRLTRQLYRTDPQVKYIDFYERALYNHILSTQNPHTGGLVYFTQTRPGHYRVYSQPHTSMWCCVGSGIENHSKYGEMIYAHTRNELYVNLYISSEVLWRDKKTRIVQETDFPDNTMVLLTVNPERRRATFAVRFRCPSWTSGVPRFYVNGKEQDVIPDNGYVTIRKKWKKGDHVMVELPMQVTAEQLPDHSGYYSMLYGPVVLAARTGTEDMKGLFADDSRGGHIAQGRVIPMKDMPVFAGSPDEIPSQIRSVPGKPLTFHLTGLYPRKYEDGMELIPFFRLHESRYILYWPQASREETENMRKRIESEEQERLRLDALTVDHVICGEQQPESDHFIQSENSATGFVEDIHWREAKGWFSYRLSDKDQQAGYLYLKYFDSDRSRKFDVMVNDQVLQSLSLDGEKGDDPVVVRYSLPDDINREQLEVKLLAHPGSMTAKIVEVRLLSGRDTPPGI